MNQSMQPSAFRQQLQTQLHQATPSIKALIPPSMSADRLARVAFRTILKSPDLMRCTVSSIVDAVVEAAANALEVDGSHGHAYIVRFGRQAQFLPGYRGKIHMATRGEAVYRSIESRLVREGDVFEVEMGTGPSIKHTPKQDSEQGNVTHVYAVAFFRDGSPAHFDVMSLDEALAVGRKSKAFSSGPWQTDTDEMLRKTVVHRLFKYLNVGPDVQRYNMLEDANQRGIMPAEFRDAEDLGDVEVVAPETPKESPPKSKPTAKMLKEIGALVGELDLQDHGVRFMSENFSVTEVSLMSKPQAQAMLNALTKAKETGDVTQFGATAATQILDDIGDGEISF